MDLTILELKNYWLPLLWMFGAGLLLSRMPKKTELLGGQIVRRWYWFTAFLLVLPLIVWAGARVSFGDTSAYRRAFNSAPSDFTSLPTYMSANSEDWAFYLMMALLKCMGMRNSSSFFLIIATIQILLMLRTFRRFSSDYWLCFFLFVVSTDYYSWMFNGMRQFLAATIIFGFFDLLVERRYISFALVVVIAAQFHASALIVLPLMPIILGPPLNRKTLLLILGVALVMPFIDRFMPILNNVLSDTQYSTITTDEVWTVDDGTNMLRVLVYSAPALIALFGYRYVRQSDDPVMHLCVNASLVTMAIYLISSVTSGIYIGRLPIYTTFQGYMALPWLIDQIFEKQTARLIKLIMIGCYAVFYYYQTGITWSLV